MCVNDKQKADCNTQKIQNHMWLHYSQQVEKPQVSDTQGFSVSKFTCKVLHHLHCNWAYCKSIYKQHLFTFNTFSFFVFLLCGSFEGESNSLNYLQDYLTVWYALRNCMQSMHSSLKTRHWNPLWHVALQRKQVLEKPKESLWGKTRATGQLAVF